MRRPKRQSFLADERVGQLRERRPTLAGARRQTRSTSKSASRMRRRNEGHRAGRVAEHRCDERLQIVFGIDDVAERRVVHGIMIACAWPTALLPIARACSSATGLRFCGMMLLDCTKPSLSRR